MNADLSLPPDIAARVSAAPGSTAATYGQHREGGTSQVLHGFTSRAFCMHGGCSFARKSPALLWIAMKLAACPALVDRMCKEDWESWGLVPVQAVSEHLDALQPAVAELARLETLAQGFYFSWQQKGPTVMLH